MRRVFAVAFAVVALVACREPDAVTWPSVTVESIDGTSVATDSVLDERPAIVSVWAIWCEPCKVELPQLQAFAAKNPGYNAFTVNLGDDPSKVQTYFDSLNITLPVLVDGDGRFTSSIKVSSVPTTVFVKAGGEVADIHKGVIDEADLERLAVKHFGG